MNNWTWEQSACSLTTDVKTSFRCQQSKVPCQNWDIEEVKTIDWPPLCHIGVRTRWPARRVLESSVLWLCDPNTLCCDLGTHLPEVQRPHCAAPPADEIRSSHALRASPHPLPHSYRHKHADVIHCITCISNWMFSQDEKNRQSEIFDKRSAAERVALTSLSVVARLHGLLRHPWAQWPRQHTFIMRWLSEQTRFRHARYKAVFSRPGAGDEVLKIGGFVRKFSRLLHIVATPLHQPSVNIFLGEKEGVGKI